MRKFDDVRTNAARAVQIWQVLIGKAHNRQMMTYGMLAELLGFGGAQVLTPMLGHIMYYCIKHGLPPLTILVVNQTSGVPGPGLIEGDLQARREEVFNYSWYKLYTPAEEEFAQAYKEREGANV